MLKEDLLGKLNSLRDNLKNFSFKKTSFALVAAGLIFTSATLVAVKISKNPDIKWTPEKLEIILFTGTSKVTSISFISNENLENAKLELVPELAKFASMEPAEINEVIAGKNSSVNLIFSVPQSTATGTYDGTLHLKLDKKTIPQTLKIILKVEEPSIDKIPFDEVSSPVSERIYKESSGATYVRDEIVIRFKKDVPLEIIKEIISGINGKIMGYISDMEIYQVYVAVASPDELKPIISSLEDRLEIIIATYHWINSLN